MTITLANVIAITATPPIVISPPLVVSEELHEKINEYLHSSEDRMPSSYSALFPKELSELQEGEELSYKETMNFYWYFLCKYASATKSKCPSKSLLPWAISLASHR